MVCLLLILVLLLLLIIAAHCLKSIEICKELTDEWKSRGVSEGQHFATLTDMITNTLSEKATKEYKVFKGLKKENLRDNMTNTELILNMLA